MHLLFSVFTYSDTYATYCQFICLFSDSTLQYTVPACNIEKVILMIASCDANSYKTLYVVPKKTF